MRELYLMEVGELLGVEELKALTPHYGLGFNWRNILFILVRPESFDVFCYVDAEKKLFEHIYDSVDYPYTMEQIVRTIVRHGEDIAAAHLSEDDIYFRAWTFYDFYYHKVREEIVDILQVVDLTKELPKRSVSYAVSTPYGYETMQVMVSRVAKWLVHSQCNKERVVDARGVHEFTLQSVRMYRPDRIKDEVVSIPKGRVIDAHTLTHYVNVDRSFNSNIINPYPVGCAKHNLYRFGARLQWVRSICDAEGNVIERVIVD